MITCQIGYTVHIFTCWLDRVLLCCCASYSKFQCICKYGMVVGCMLILHLKVRSVASHSYTLILNYVYISMPICWILPQLIYYTNSTLGRLPWTWSIYLLIYFLWSVLIVNCSITSVALYTFFCVGSDKECIFSSSLMVILFIP